MKNKLSDTAAWETYAVFSQQRLDKLPICQFFSGMSFSHTLVVGTFPGMQCVVLGLFFCKAKDTGIVLFLVSIVLFKEHHRAQSADDATADDV